jgi:hypothetical protein
VAATRPSAAWPIAATPAAPCSRLEAPLTSDSPYGGTGNIVTCFLNIGRSRKSPRSAQVFKHLIPRTHAEQFYQRAPGEAADVQRAACTANHGRAMAGRCGLDHRRQVDHSAVVACPPKHAKVINELVCLSCSRRGRAAGDHVRGWYGQGGERG